MTLIGLALGALLLSLALAVLTGTALRRVSHDPLDYEASAHPPATRPALRLVPPVSDPVGHPRLERPELDEARARLLREQPARLAKARELRVVQRVR